MNAGMRLVGCSVKGVRFLYVIDRYVIYSMFLEEITYIISKTYSKTYIN
jgi:hypothetical protein